MDQDAEPPHTTVTPPPWSLPLALLPPIPLDPFTPGFFDSSALLSDWMACLTDYPSNTPSQTPLTGTSETTPSPPLGGGTELDPPLTRQTRSSTKRNT